MVESVFKEITDTLTKGEAVKLSGFGSFDVPLQLQQRAAGMRQDFMRGRFVERNRSGTPCQSPGVKGRCRMLRGYFNSDTEGNSECFQACPCGMGHGGYVAVTD